MNPATPLTQQAPVGVGVGHWAVAQLVFAPRQMPWCATQSASVVWMQVTPAEEFTQQAPVAGGVQVVLVHCVPLPR
jgi:hypothetical protein